MFPALPRIQCCRIFCACSCFLFLRFISCIMAALSIYNLCVMQEFNGVTEYQYTTWFDEEGVVVLNLTSHAEGKLRYTSLKRIFETDHIFVLQTKNKQFVPIFKSGLSAAEVEELTVFLKPQNKKIKIDRLKKCNHTGTH